MAEPIDAVLPILRNMQSDLADVKRTQAAHGEKLDSIEGYLTYSLGIQQRHVADIETIKEQIAEMKRRIAALEKRK
jgi:Tfp pilus assembly protein PilO